MAGSIPPITMPPPRQDRGFPWLLFGCGCLAAVVVLVGILGYSGYRMVVGLVEQYTDTTPMELPASTFSDADYSALQTRVKTFREALNKNEPTAPLVLNADEINALIDRDPEWSNAKGRVHVEINDDKIGGKISLPLDELNFPGRYFNGAATFTAFVRDERLYVHIETLEVNGKPVPESFMASMRSENAAKNFNQDPQFKDIREKIGNIVIANDTLTIEAKAGAPTP